MSRAPSAARRRFREAARAAWHPGQKIARLSSSLAKGLQTLRTSAFPFEKRG
jgi:hypothetical protein